MPGMDDEERARQTAQVLKLLDDSYLAYAAGNREESDRLGRAACQLDVDVVSVVQGAMLIGELRL